MKYNSAGIFSKKSLKQLKLQFQFHLLAESADLIVLEGTIIPPRTLYAGVPAKLCGEVRDELQNHLSKTADRYVEYAGWFRGSEV